MSSMHANSREFLSSLVRMEPAALRNWLARQSPEQRQQLLRLAQQEKKQVKEELWELKKTDRVTQTLESEGKNTISKIDDALASVLDVMANNLEVIYKDPQTALKTLWGHALHDSGHTREVLRSQPGRFGALAGFSLLIIPSPGRVRALIRARNFDFLGLWETYNHLQQIKLYLHQRLENV